MSWKIGKRSVARQDATSLGSHKPLARAEGLIVEELGDEVLVYDSHRDTAHCLSPDAAHVWQHCDGESSIESMSARVDLSAERIDEALSELERCELLEVSPSLSANGHTRRELSLKVAKVGAATAAVPLIVSVAAPAPAMAVTPAFCLKFSSGSCGNNSGDGVGTGCKADVGCCCCHTPVQDPYPAPTGDFAGTQHPCVAGNSGGGGECKTCVPCDQDDRLCPMFGHPDDCSAGDAGALCGTGNN